MYLLGEVFRSPGLVVGRSLSLLPSLSLLQPVFVLRGLVHVPFLQRLGDMLPQPPTSRSETTRSHAPHSVPAWCHFLTGFHLDSVRPCFSTGRSSLRVTGSLAVSITLVSPLLYVNSSVPFHSPWALHTMVLVGLCLTSAVTLRKPNGDG